MITLKTLHEATEQEIFDQVANHLLTQMQKSETNNGDSCSYKTKFGLKCAAGCLIADDEYNPEFEGYSWDVLIEREQVPKYHQRLIQELQDIHDDCSVCDWKDELKYLANKRNLKWKF